MTFREILEGMHGRDPAVRGVALAGADGLPVEEWASPGTGADLPALCAEMVQLFKESSRFLPECGGGGPVEIAVRGEQGHVFLRKVTPDYFLLLLADPGAIPGKCRFLARQGADRARELL